MKDDREDRARTLVNIEGSILDVNVTERRGDADEPIQLSRRLPAA